MPGRAAVAVTATILALAACGDGGTGDQRADQARQAAEEAGLSEEVQDFLALAAQGATSTYQATYAAAGAEGGPDRQVTVTQRPPDRRLDVVNPDGTTEATLQVGGATYQCRQEAEQWSCKRAGDVTPIGAGAFDPAAVSATTEALADVADDYEFVIEERSIVGSDATCLVTTLRPERAGDASLGASATLCVSEQGVPLLIERPGERVTATRYTTELDDGAFDLPT